MIQTRSTAPFPRVFLVSLATSKCDRVHCFRLIYYTHSRSRGQQNSKVSWNSTIYLCIQPGMDHTASCSTTVA